MPHAVDMSWNAQSGVDSYTVQYIQTQGASQLGDCKNSTHSGSVSTTDASASTTVQGSGDDMVRVFTTYSITVTAVTVNRGSSAPSAAVFVTTAQTGSTIPVFKVTGYRRGRGFKCGFYYPVLAHYCQYGPEN